MCMFVCLNNVYMSLLYSRVYLFLFFLYGKLDFFPKQLNVLLDLALRALKLHQIFFVISLFFGWLFSRSLFSAPCNAPLCYFFLLKRQPVFFLFVLPQFWLCSSFIYYIPALKRTCHTRKKQWEISKFLMDRQNHWEIIHDKMKCTVQRLLWHC